VRSPALRQQQSPVFGQGLMLASDIDEIEALNPERAALWERQS